jgi:hypothetical protein
VVDQTTLWVIPKGSPMIQYSSALKRPWYVFGVQLCVTCTLLWYFDLTFVQRGQSFRSCDSVMLIMQSIWSFNQCAISPVFCVLSICCCCDNYIYSNPDYGNITIKRATLSDVFAMDPFNSISPNNSSSTYKVHMERKLVSKHKCFPLHGSPTQTGSYPSNLCLTKTLNEIHRK